MDDNLQGRVLGLDVGAKTVGVAVSDELRVAAHPVTTVARRGIPADVQRIVELVTEHAIVAVVVGLPLELDGTVGPRCRRVRKLTDALTAALPGIPLHEWDERFSTAAVENVLIDGNVSRSKRKRIIDRQAAVYILQGWLDAQPTNQ